MSAPHVEVSGLQVSVARSDGGRHAIVDDIGFAIERGQVLALIGESGSGKTTIGLALLGHTRFSSEISAGTIRVGEHAICDLSEVELRKLRGTKITYVAQSAAAAFNPSRTIMSQVIEPLTVHGLASEKEAKAKAIEIFRNLSLPQPETIGARYPHQVSGGQLQRLMAAMALITEPELIILDEPTTALDVTTQVDVLKSFKSALAASQATAIYVSHDLSVVAQIADQVLVLKDGRMVETGAATKLLTDPDAEYTASLLAAADAHAVSKASEQQAEPVLALRNVVAGYGGIRDGKPVIPVLRDISFKLGAGEALGVIGESGSGKSTLARVIAGLLPAASGCVSLDGEILPPALDDRSRDQLRRVQIVFQNADTALNPAQSVRETIGRPLAFYRGLKGAELEGEVHRLLDLTRLPRELASRMSSELSGGQKQRINLARALAADPAVLLCDEVTSALDTVVSAAIIDLIDDLRRELGIATVFISHDISTARSFCDRLMVLYAGCAVEQATREQFSVSTPHPYAELLLRSVPEMRAGWLEDVRAAGEPPVSAGAGAQDLCPFLPRCEVALQGKCDALPPPVRELDGHSILCHRDRLDHADA